MNWTELYQHRVQWRVFVATLIEPSSSNTTHQDLVPYYILPLSYSFWFHRPDRIKEAERAHAVRSRSSVYREQHPARSRDIPDCIFAP